MLKVIVKCPHCKIKGVLVCNKVGSATSTRCVCGENIKVLTNIISISSVPHECKCKEKENSYTDDKSCSE